VSDYGFVVNVDGTEAALTSVSVSGSNVVIELTSEPIGPVNVRYALDNAEAGSPVIAQGGGQGSLRDSTTDAVVVNGTTYNLWHVGWHYESEPEFGMSGGTELHADPDFDSAAAWTAAGAWSVAGGVASITNSSSRVALRDSATRGTFSPGLYYFGVSITGNDTGGDLQLYEFCTGTSVLLAAVGSFEGYILIGG